MGHQGLDDLREYILRKGATENEKKLLNVIAIMEETIEFQARNSVGLDFYLQVEDAIDTNVSAMLAVVEGRVH